MQQEYLDYAYLNLTDKEIENASRLISPLAIVHPKDKKNLGLKELRIMRTPEYLFWASKILLNLEMTPMHAVILQELWGRAFPLLIGTRGFSKTFLMAQLALLKMRLIPGCQIVIAGAAFRQAKLVFEYMERIWNSAPILRSTCDHLDGPKRDNDRMTFRIGDSNTAAIPIGVDGEKIRGLRANVIFADEFNSIPIHIYETVIANFGTVSKNPVDMVKSYAKREKLIKAGKWTLDQEERFNKGTVNQQVLSGTAGYEFEHFYKYFDRYHKIITSGGDMEKLRAVDADGLNWRNFSIIRIPYELVPKGFLEPETVARAKATIQSDSFKREFGAVFTKDSQGFFKRSLIESCTARETKPIMIGQDPLVFNACIKQQSTYPCVMGVDPASEQDNLAITVVEMRENHSRVVYCWTINRKKFEKKITLGILQRHDYYQYCVLKIRELMRDFNIVRIMMDAQGGGRTLQQALQNPPDGTIPILEIIEENKEKITDGLHGLHILEMCQFGNAKWTSEANHGLKFDMEQKLLLFPNFDAISLAMTAFVDKTNIEDQGYNVDTDNFSLYDSLEDCVLEIEEMKNEMSNIVITKSLNGVERWDTPEKRTAKQKYLKKDRYSALVMANMGARNCKNAISPPKFLSVGIRVGQTERPGKEKSKKGRVVNPEWYNPPVGSYKAI